MKSFIRFLEQIFLQKNNSNTAAVINRDILKNYPDISMSIILALDKKGNVTYINRKGADMLGLPAARIIGKNWFDNFIPGEDALALRNNFKKMISGKNKYFEFNENPVVDAKGRRKFIVWHNAVSYTAEGGINGAISSGEDITALKECNARLKQSIDRYNVTLETATSAIASVDLTGRILEYNRAAAEIFGVNKSDMIGKPLASVMTPGSVIKALSKLVLVQKKGYAYGGEYQIKTKSGEIKDVVISSAAVKDEKGKFIKTISVIEDITEKKFVEAVLRESEEKYRTMFNAVGDAVFVHTLSRGGEESRFVAVNEVACTRMGYKREELLRLGVYDISPPEKYQAVKKAMKKLIKEGKLTGEAVHVSKDGTVIPVEVNARIVNLGGRLTAIATARDITDRKNSEKINSEQVVFTALRTGLWQIAADKSLSEVMIIRQVLDLLGPSLGCARVVYSVLEKESLLAVMEWKSQSAKVSALGVKIPKVIIEQLGLDKQKVLDKEAILKLIPAAIRPLALPLLKVLIKKFGDTPSILTPFFLNNQWAGCINCTAESITGSGSWNAERMNLLTEAANIISSAIEARRTLNTIEKQYAYEELRAKLWKLASDINRPEDSIIQALLDETAQVVGAERMVYGNPDNDKFRVKLEWKHDRLKKSFSGFTFPLEIYNKFELLEQKVYDSKNLIAEAPKAIRPLLSSMMKVVSGIYGDSPSLVTPYLINGKREGVIVCSAEKGKKLWTEDEKSVIKEAAVIIANVISVRRSELYLTQNAGSVALRAQLWRLAADDSLAEDDIIKNLVEMLGPVLKCERVVYTAQRAEKMKVLYEWKKAGIKGNVAGIKADVSFFDITAMDKQVILTKEVIAGFVPSGTWKILGPFINMLISKFGNNPVLSTPCIVDGKKEGIIICTGDEQPVTKWSVEKKHLVLEAAQIITRIIENRRAGRLARESGMKYKSLFENMSEAVYVAELTGSMRILEVNDTACLRTGYSKKEMLEMTLAGFLGEKGELFSEAGRRALEKKGKIQFETEQPVKNGKVTPVEISGNVIEYNGKDAFIAVVKDLTEAKKNRLENELGNFYTALNAEIWRIAADVSLDEKNMIYKLLQRTGSDFKASRASYSVPVNGELTGMLQWAAPGVKQSIHHTSPDYLMNFMKKDKLYEFETNRGLDFIPFPARGVVKKIMSDVAGMLGIKTIMAVPVFLDGKPGGVISFDVESGNSGFTGVDSHKRKIAVDLANIVAQGIARRRAEKKLEQSEKLYREVFNNANDGIVLQELIMKPGEQPGARMLEFNEMTCKIFDIEREEMKDLRLQDLVDAEGMKLIWKTTGEASRSGAARDEVMAMKTKKGRKIMVEMRSKIFEFGEIQIILSVVRDITDKLRITNALVESEELYRTLINTSPDAVIMSDTAGQIVFASDRMAKLHGYGETTELIGRGIFDFVDTQSRSSVVKEFKEFILKGSQVNMEYKALRKNGSTFTGEIYASLIKGPGGAPKNVIATIRDVSQRVKAVEDLRLSEEKYRSVISRTGQLIYEYDANNGVITWDGAVEEITGYTVEEYNREVSIDFWAQMIHPEDRARVIAEMEKAQQVCGKLHNEYRYRHKNGSYIYIEDDSTFVADDEGKVCRKLGVMKNITQRKENEAAIIESEKKFRTLSEQSMLSIAILQENHFVYFNDAFWKMNGYSREEITHWTAEDFYSSIHEEDVPVVKQRLRQRMSGDHDLPPNFKLRIYSKDKEVKWLDVYETETIYKGKPAVFITEADITSLKNTEKKLTVSVGELTRSNAELEQFAYVASHDLQEPLRMVSSYVQLLKRRYEGKLGQDADDFIGFAVDGADRMQKLIKDLLVYSRIGANRKANVTVDLNTVMNTVRLNMAKSIEETGAVIKSGPLPEVFADEAQMVQLMQNLISNAIKFMHEGKAPEIEISAVVDKTECTVSVKDNGIGIDKQYFDKVFVIFQRLHGKSEYPGTGIGLSICRKIVESHGGHIWLESEEGKGTKFYFTVPLVKK